MIGPYGVDGMVGVILHFIWYKGFIQLYKPEEV